LSASSASVPAAAPRSAYASGARVLSVGIATTGVVTFAYFALAAHALAPAQYTRISLLWSIMFVIVSVIYRPIEQLLSRTIAERRARGQASGGTHLRVALLIQAAFAAAFLAAALAARHLLQDGVFDGSAELYWILVAGVLAYAASYFARGFASGQSAVALGMAAAPFVSLVVVPAFFARRDDPPADPAAVKASEGGLTLRRGAGFALAVFGVMVSEQTLLNAAVLTVAGTSDDVALAGIVFSVLLIARAPLQLFQAVQGSLLPHLAGLQATAGATEFRRAIRVTVLASGAFGLAVALGLFAIGPEVVGRIFDIDRDLPRAGLALVGLGMGLHLVAGTLNQAALARGQAPGASAAWLASAGAFVAFMLSPLVGDQLLRAELGYAGATALLSALLAIVYRRGSASVSSHRPRS
jgi:O-antigen/teichoic acid export membrane protein